MNYNNLIAPHRKYMFNHAYKLCKNRTEAEDITQEALIKAYKYSLNNQIDERKVKSFLATTVRNTLIDSKRRRKHRQDIEINASEQRDGFDEALLESFQDSFTYDKIIDSMEILYYVEPVMEKLKKYKTLYKMLNYYLEEHTYEEIAQLMKTNVGTVKSRLYQARKFVRENISEEFLAKI